jgi:nucleotide-binding universal stress UspA family protein
VQKEGSRFAGCFFLERKTMSEHDQAEFSIAENAQGGILVGVDFSDDSKAAVIWGCRQAEATGQALVLLHVVHDPASEPGFYLRKTTREMQPLQDIAEQMMDDFLAALRVDHPGLQALDRAVIRLVPGLPANRMVEVAQLLDASLIVIGSRGRSSISSILLGSVADRVVRVSTRPVVVVKSETSKSHKKEMKKEMKRQKKEHKRLKKLLGLRGSKGRDDEEIDG